MSHLHMLPTYPTRIIFPALLSLIFAAVTSLPSLYLATIGEYTDRPIDTSVQQSSIVACVFVAAVTFLLSRCLATVRGILPSRWLATIRGYTFRQTEGRDL
jgi:hypothetical protein